MKIVVLVKQTPDSEAKIKISNDDKSRLEDGGTKFVVNPYDEFAIEEALKIKEKAKDPSEVIIVSMGDDSVKDRIIKALAMGADRGLQISSSGLESLDSLTVAKVLAKAIEGENPDLVLCGKQAIDDDNMHVGVMLAELLHWPHVNVVNKIEIDTMTAFVEREVEGGQVEKYKVGLPAVLGANKALNTPRYASLPGIMKAKRKPFDRKTPADIGIDINQLKSELMTQVTAYQYPAEKPQGKIFKGEAADIVVKKVVKLLRDEAKVI